MRSRKFIQTLQESQTEFRCIYDILHTTNHIISEPYRIDKGFRIAEHLLIIDVN